MNSLHSSVSAGRLVFTGKQQVHLESFSLDSLKETEVLIQIHFSLMSTGTENIIFNRLFDSGTHWDRWAQYPFYPGYAASGTVVATGKKVSTLKVGDHVVCSANHQSHVILEEKSCSPIPQTIPLDDAIWAILAKISFMGAKAAHYFLGDTVLIIGAGPIGQTSIRWASAAGARSIIVVDPSPERMPFAQRGGATNYISKPVDQALEDILAADEGRRPRVVIDATGNSSVFEAAQGIADTFGTVVILGDTGHPTQQNLTSDLITRGLNIIGAHVNHQTPEWNTFSIHRLFVSLVMSNRFSLKGLNTHYFDPTQCLEAYTFANSRRDVTMGIVFDWRKQVNYHEIRNNRN